MSCVQNYISHEIFRRQYLIELIFIIPIFYFFFFLYIINIHSEETKSCLYKSESALILHGSQSIFRCRNPNWNEHLRVSRKGLGNALIHSAHLFSSWYTTSLEEVTLGKDISELSQGNIEILGSILMVEHINHPLAGYHVTSSFSEWEKQQHTTLEHFQVWTSWVFGCLCKGPALGHSQTLLMGSTDHSWGCQMPETQWMCWLQLSRDVLLGKWVRSTGSET